MGETTEALGDLWGAVRKDAENILDTIGLGDPAIIGPIIGTVIAGLIVWFIINNVLG
jgi:hypothetical protein